MLSKNTSLNVPVSLSKRLTYATKGPGTKKPGEELKATTAEMERIALNAAINLVEINQLVDLPQFVEHRVVEERVALFNSNGTYRNTQNSNLIQKLSFFLSFFLSLSLSLSLSHTHTHTLSLSLCNLYICWNPTSLSSTWS